MRKKWNNWAFIVGIAITQSLSAHATTILSDEFVRYHLNAAVDEVEDEDLFHLIQENIKNLDNAGTSNSAAKELINLIEEGHTIDPFSLAKLIELLKHANGSNNATKVIIKAIEHNSPLTTDHMINLIKTLTHANASNNAAKIILIAIDHGVKFGYKERLELAEASKVANARSNVEKIRKALHERETKKNT